MEQLYEAVTEAAHHTHNARQALLRGDTPAACKHYETAGNGILKAIKSLPKKDRTMFEIHAMELLYEAGLYRSVVSSVQAGMRAPSWVSEECHVRAAKEYIANVKQQAANFFVGGQYMALLDFLRENITAFPASQSCTYRRDCCRSLGLAALGQEFQRDLDSLSGA